MNEKKQTKVDEFDIEPTRDNARDEKFEHIQPKRTKKNDPTIISFIFISLGNSKNAINKRIINKKTSNRRLLNDSFVPKESFNKYIAIIGEIDFAIIICDNFIQ